MNDLLLTGGTIITLDPEKPLLEDKTLLIRDGKIAIIGDPEDFIQYETESICCSGKIIMPGFINCHHHFYSTMACGLTTSLPSSNFNEVLQNLWWRLDKKLLSEDIYYSALISLIDSIKHGTTTIFDHHASPGAVRGSLKNISKAVLISGLRACLCYEVSDRDGLDTTADGIAENLHWIENVSNKENSFLRGLFGLHAAFTLGDKTLSKIAEETVSLKCGYHLHVAEALSDQEHSHLHYGKGVVNRLSDFGLLNRETIAAHCVHISEQEMDILKHHDVAVVHNPQSNLNNAVGIADICRLSEKGIQVGLGTDAMTNNMLEELRTSLWAQHWNQKNPTIAFSEITSTLLYNNPLIANRYWDNSLGKIAEGMYADLIVFDYQPATPLTIENWIGHIIYGISQASVETTIVQGKVLMWNHQLFLDLDEEEIRCKSRELATKLWKRF